MVDNPMCWQDDHPVNHPSKWNSGDKIGTFYLSQGRVIAGSRITYEYVKEPGFPATSPIAGQESNVAAYSQPRIVSANTIFYGLVPTTIPIDGPLAVLIPGLRYSDRSARCYDPKERHSFEDRRVNAMIVVEEKGDKSVKRIKPDYRARILKQEENFLKASGLLFGCVEKSGNEAWKRFLPSFHRSLNIQGVDEVRQPVAVTGIMRDLPFVQLYRYDHPYNRPEVWMHAMLYRTLHGFKLLSALLLHAITLYTLCFPKETWIAHLTDKEMDVVWLESVAGSSSADVSLATRVGCFLDLSDRHSIGMLNYCESFHVPCWWTSHIDSSTIPDERFRPYLLSEDEYAAASNCEKDRARFEGLRIDRYRQSKQWHHDRQAEIYPRVKRSRAWNVMDDDDDWKVMEQTFTDYRAAKENEFDRQLQNVVGLALQSWKDKRENVKNLTEIGLGRSNYVYFEWKQFDRRWKRKAVPVGTALQLLEELDCAGEEAGVLERAECFLSGMKHKTGIVEFTIHEANISTSMEKMYAKMCFGDDFYPLPETYSTPEPDVPNVPPPALEIIDNDDNSPELQLVLHHKDSPYQLRFGFNEIPHESDLAALKRDEVLQFAHSYGFHENKGDELRVCHEGEKNFTYFYNCVKNSTSVQLPNSDLTLLGQDLGQANPDASLKVTKFNGIDKEPLYLLEPFKHPVAKNKWLLAVTSATTAVQCIRTLRANAGMSVERLALELLTWGIPFRTLMPVDEPAGNVLTRVTRKRNNTRPDTFRYRRNGWKASGPDFDNMTRGTEEKMPDNDDRFGRACLTHGGIAWRLANEFYQLKTEEVVLRGPTPPTSNTAIYFIPSKGFFYDDELTVRDCTVLSGTTSRNSENKRDWLEDMYWPLPFTWESATGPGFWNTAQEEWFIKRYRKYKLGAVPDLPNGLEWREQLETVFRFSKFRKTVESKSKIFLTQLAGYKDETNISSLNVK